MSGDYNSPFYEGDVNAQLQDNFNRSGIPYQNTDERESLKLDDLEDISRTNNPDSFADNWFNPAPQDHTSQRQFNDQSLKSSRLDYFLGDASFFDKRSVNKPLDNPPARVPPQAALSRYAASRLQNVRTGSNSPGISAGMPSQKGRAIRGSGSSIVPGQSSPYSPQDNQSHNPGNYPSDSKDIGKETLVSVPQRGPKSGGPSESPAMNINTMHMQQAQQPGWQQRMGTPVQIPSGPAGSRPSDPNPHGSNHPYGQNMVMSQRQSVPELSSMQGPESRPLSGMGQSPVVQNMMRFPNINQASQGPSPGAMNQNRAPRQAPPNPNMMGYPVAVPRSVPQGPAMPQMMGMSPQDIHNMRRMSAMSNNSHAEIAEMTTTNIPIVGGSEADRNSKTPDPTMHMPQQSGIYPTNVPSGRQSTPQAMQRVMHWQQQQNEARLRAQGQMEYQNSNVPLHLQAQVQARTQTQGQTPGQIPGASNEAARLNAARMRMQDPARSRMFQPDFSARAMGNVGSVPGSQPQEDLHGKFIPNVGFARPGGPVERFGDRKVMPPDEATMTGPRYMKQEYRQQYNGPKEQQEAIQLSLWAFFSMLIVTKKTQVTINALMHRMDGLPPEQQVSFLERCLSRWVTDVPPPSARIYMPHLSQDRFFSVLFDLMQKSGVGITPTPLISQKPVNLFVLFEAVQSQGGFIEVTRSFKWHRVSELLSLSARIDVVQELISVYTRMLYIFEECFNTQPEFRRRLGEKLVLPEPVKTQMSTELFREPTSNSPRLRERPRQLYGFSVIDGKKRLAHGGERSAKRQLTEMPFLFSYDNNRYVLQRWHNTNFGGRNLKNVMHLGTEIEVWRPDVAFPLDLGIVDLHAVTLSLRSLEPAEVRQALDKLIVVTANPRVHTSLQHCPRLVANLCIVIRLVLQLLLKNKSKLTKPHPRASSDSIPLPKATTLAERILEKCKKLASEVTPGDIALTDDSETGVETHRSNDDIMDDSKYKEIIHEAKAEDKSFDNQYRNFKPPDSASPILSEFEGPLEFIYYTDRIERVERNFQALGEPEDERDAFFLNATCNRLLGGSCVLRNLSFAEQNKPVIAGKPEFLAFLWEALYALASRPSLLDSDLRTIDFCKDILVILSNIGLHLVLDDPKKTLILILFLLSFSAKKDPFIGDEVFMYNCDTDVHRHVAIAIDVFVKVASRDDPNCKVIEMVLRDTCTDLDYRKLLHRCFPARKNLRPCELLTRMFTMVVSALPSGYTPSQPRDQESRRPLFLQLSLAAEILSNMLPTAEDQPADAPTPWVGQNLAEKWLNSIDHFGARLLRTVNFMGMVIIPATNRDPISSESTRPYAKVVQRIISMIHTLIRKSGKDNNKKNLTLYPTVEHLLGCLMAPSMDKLIVRHLSSLYEESQKTSEPGPAMQN